MVKKIATIFTILLTFPILAQDISGVWKLENVIEADGSDTYLEVKESKVAFIEKRKDGSIWFRRFTSGKLTRSAEIKDLKYEAVDLGSEKVVVNVSLENGKLKTYTEQSSDIYTKTNFKTEDEAKKLSLNNPVFNHLENVKNNNPSLKTIKVASETLKDKEIVFYGYAKLSSYYAFEYGKSKDSHFSLDVRGDSNEYLHDFHVYFLKSKFPKLIEDFELKGRKPIFLRMLLQKEKHSSHSLATPMFEGIEYSNPY